LHFGVVLISKFEKVKDKHNAELQRTAPGTKDLGAFSLKRHKHFFLNIYVCVLCSSGIDKHEIENKGFFFFKFFKSILKEWSKKFGFGANGQVDQVRHCQVEEISIIKENPQEEEQVIVELDIV